MFSTTEKVHFKDAALERRHIEHLIASGQNVFLVDGNVIRADSWLQYHPGGDKIIQHMVGRDATDEVHALHSPEALRRMRAFQIGRVEGRWTNFIPPIQGGHYRLQDDNGEEDNNEKSATAFVTEVPDDEAQFSSVDIASQSSSRSSSGSPRNRKGTSPAEAVLLTQLRLDEDPASRTSLMNGWTEEATAIDISRYPVLDPCTQEQVVQKYRALYQCIQAEKLFQCNYKAYAIELSRYFTLFSICLVAYFNSWYIVSGLFLGMFWHQLVFTAHDAGHMGITHDFTTDTVIGIVVADFIGGLSLGWWKRSHNIHHVVTNSVEHDPDVELMPFFALSHRMFDSLTSTFYDKVMPYDAVSRWAVRHQHWLYYPILTFGRFNLYRLSWEHLFFGYGPRKGEAAWTRWLEIVGQVFFWAWFGSMVFAIPSWFSRVAFVMISHMATMPLHVQITLSHYAMSTAEVGPAESFPQRMLRTTMDVQCPEWLDFIHGGLQFQAIHHLFPRMPRHNLRRAQGLVQAFCEEVDIPYALLGFVQGNQKVIGRLGDIGRQASILAQCQQAISGENPLSHHH